MPVSHQVVSEEEVRLALQTVLASETFGRSPQLSRLLKYLCDTLLTHGAERIAEYTIGAEALGRPRDFDPAQDAAVRVEMHRLRRRLRDYYAAEGARDPIRIEIPSGRYAPVFTRAGEPPAEISDSQSSQPEMPAVAAAPPPSALGRARWMLWAAAAVGIVVAPAAWIPWRAAGGPAGARADAATLSGPGAAAPDLDFRVGCGRRGPWTDRLGRIWTADANFEGGEAIELPARPYLAGALDRRLFQSARAGTFHYRIPLPNRTYELRLYFVEPVYGPENDQGGEGNRLFRVVLNGRTVLDRFDILTDANGPWTADVRVFKDVTPGPDGVVGLDFESITGVALLNAIEFVPARPHVLNAVRVLPQDNFYTDSAGNLWTPDNYSRGGRVAIHPGPVRNTRDQEIFRHERFGRFSYAVPVDRGLYSVYVYMAEEYWGPGNPGGGGAGTRLFDIFCNGTALARGLDLYREAGINQGIVRAFHHLAPNAQGKLVLSFEPDHDYASIFGLEVIDEAGPDRPSCESTVAGACS